uniref:Uncharacterized protein n=1 Tax=Arundo donax TaxID=35708 RepID=A0A0A8YUX7_ARUDO
MSPTNEQEARIVLGLKDYLYIVASLLFFTSPFYARVQIVVII